MQAALSSPTLSPDLSREARVSLRGADADGRVRQLVAARGLLRPRLAALALVLVRKRRYEPLGFRCLGDYGRERLGVGARALREWARVWEALSELPQLRGALLGGEVSFSVAGRVVAVATPETDQACVETVCGRTVRAVETLLRAVSGDVEPAEAAGEEARVRVDVPLEPLALPRWAAACELARRMAGEALPVWECAELISAETLAAIGSVGSVQPGEQPRAPKRSAGPTAADAGQGESGLRHEAFPALRFGGLSRLRPELLLERERELEALEAWAADACAHDLDAALCEAMRRLQQLDGDLGLLLGEILERRLHRELGFARFDRYVEERVDVAARTVRRWMQLARLDGEPGGAVATALRTGEITEMQASLVAQASTPTSAPEWVALARQVTLRRLETEVAACTAGACAGPAARVSFFAPPEVASVFHAALTAVRTHLAGATGRPAPPARALAWMLEHAIAAWLEQGASFKDYADFNRDHFRCTAPGCTARRSLQSHHIVRRSAGGADEPWNRTTLCAFHHQRGIHAGLVHCRGRAPDALVFALGVRTGGPPLLRARSGDVLEPASP